MNPALYKGTCYCSSLLTIGIAAVVFSGCSRAARQADLLEAANRYYAAGEYEKAEIEYKNALQTGNVIPDALARLGVIYHEQGREARAIPLLLKAKELQPENLDVRLKLGLSFLSSGNLKAAREEALYVLARRPQDSEAPLLLIEAAATDGKELEAARKYLAGLPDTAAHRAAIMVALAVADLRQGHVQAVEAALKAAQEAEPEFPAAPTALGLLYWAQNKLPDADAALKRAANLSPPRSPRRLKYAEFKVQTGDLAAAKQILEDMGKATPDYRPVWVLRAEIAATEKKYDECDAFLAKVLTRDANDAEAMLLRARVNLARGEKAKAVAELENLNRLYPQSAPVCFHLGLAYLQNGDSNKAIAALSRAVAAAPNMDHAVLALAELNIRRRDFSPAIQALKQLITQRPGLPMARALLAEAYRGQGNFDDAAAIYRQLEEQFPKDPQAPFWRGMVLVQQGRTGEARKAFERVWELAPGNIAPLEQLVELDLRDRNFVAARQRVATEIQRDPAPLEPHLLLARVQGAQGDSAAAEATLLKAASLHPESAAAHLGVARAYVSARQPEKALASLQRVTTLAPSHLEGWLLTGMMEEARKNRAAARDAYEKALALDPKNILALNNLAYLYAEHLNELDRAGELAQTARDIQPGNAYAADTLGWILYQQHQYPRALSLLEESAAKLPQMAEVQFHLGLAHYAMGAEESARHAFERALELKAEFPGSDEARERLSILAIAPGTGGADTRTRLEEVLTKRNDDGVALCRLAAIYEQGGASDKALESYERLLKSNPGNVPVALNAIRLYRSRHEDAKAFELAKATRKLAPGDVPVAHVLGRLAFDSADYGWAASVLQEAARKQTSDPELLYDLGAALYSTGREGEAQTTMREALALNPAFPRAGAARQFLEFSAWSADPAGAAAATGQIERALQTNPADVPALMAMGTVCEHRSDASGAKKHYERVLQYYPDFTPALKRLALLYVASPKDNSKAVEFATKARKALPDDPEVAKALGVAVLREGNYGRARSLMEECARRRTDDGEVMYYLGVAQAQLKRQAEAKQALERALELGLNDELATQARQSLAKLP